MARLPLMPLVCLAALAAACDGGGEPADPCAGVTCSGLGDCAVLGGSEPVCVCRDGHHAEGLTCVPDSDACQDVACGGHGDCVLQAGAALCVCDIGYHADGLVCVENDPLDPCAAVDCSGHGQCRAEGGAASCACDAGYHAEGLACLEDVVAEPCQGVTCSGHGRCEVVADQATCACDPGYAPDGLACLAVDVCAGVDCSGHGSCSAPEGIALCACEPGYVPSGLACVESGAPGPGPVWFVHNSDHHFGDSDDAATRLEVLQRDLLPILEPAAAVLSGDTTEGGTGPEWAAYHGAIDAFAPLYPAWVEIPGNHDVKEDGEDRFRSEAIAGRAGAGLYGQALLDTAAGPVRLLRANTADSDLVAVNLSGSFGAAQATALMALEDGDPPSAYTLVTGHHPMTGPLRLYLGFERMQTLLAATGAQAYLCGHVHAQAFTWLGDVLVVQADSLGKSDAAKAILLALDQTGPSAKLLPLDGSQTWPLVMITSPADDALGGVNPRAATYPPGSQVLARALVFAPGALSHVEFRLGGEVFYAAEIREHVWEATVTLPASAESVSLTAVATGADGASDDAITFDVGP
ncbi:MAG TPA: metallophosphoesterase [Myxococcota bacterium]|nr:metallophosphoesterase [Myxococcota bacterium]